MPPKCLSGLLTHAGFSPVNEGKRQFHHPDVSLAIEVLAYFPLKPSARVIGQRDGRLPLLALARGRQHEALDRSIDVQISRLQRLIEADRTVSAFARAGYREAPTHAVLDHVVRQALAGCATHLRLRLECHAAEEQPITIHTACQTS
jgi:hypothetical protein